MRYVKELVEILPFMDLLNTPVIDTKKQVSKGIQLPKKVWKARRKRVKAQKQSRKLNRS